MRRTGYSPPPPSKARSANLQNVVPIVAYFNHPPRLLPSLSASNQLNSSKSIVSDAGPIVTIIDYIRFLSFFFFPPTSLRSSRMNERAFHSSLLVFDQTSGRDEGGDCVRVRAERNPIDGYATTLDGMPPSYGRGGPSGDPCSGRDRA